MYKTRTVRNVKIILSRLVLSEMTWRIIKPKLLASERIYEGVYELVKFK